ncbi:hypothetical protein Mgra_00004129 [Meloidogyne graminicola]|uniref:Uncharacterized protein n=1 Tax=Meloidogyne graminicola TaxID=189291 RepID=A0A8S9ZSB6_9BILA|nr:hypothetical protein Mgra_00004129 [Meloidogyne graminicola]
MAAINRELQGHSKQLSERLSESLYILDHDPSMALYRIQEHINKVAPKLVIRRQNMFQLNNQIQGACFDLDNAIKTIEQMKRAQSSLERVKSIMEENNN